MIRLQLQACTQHLVRICNAAGEDVCEELKGPPGPDGKYMIDPFEADVSSIKKTVNYIMKEQGRGHMTIEELLNTNKNFEPQSEIEIYKKHKN